ncbi:hypothetical protein [Deinococcus sp. YIM 77859]|nr:hypothetical protein [Deinococcus sp. YIM 77859]
MQKAWTDKWGTLTVTSTRGMFAYLVPDGVSLADELVQERHDEAARE